MLSSEPPALTAPPSANAIAEARSTLMLTSAAAPGLTATARSESPARVQCSQPRQAHSIAEPRKAAIRLSA